MAEVSEVSNDRLAEIEQFRRIRRASLAMCEPISGEEYRLQPLADVSPPWWNLGHTSWFFVRNLLAPFGGELSDDDEQFDYLLNSYYESLGQRLARDQRGSISRPTTAEILEYRQSVDRRVEALLETLDDTRWCEASEILTIGLQHEQQHQELFYTEIKYIRYQNPLGLRDAYVARRHGRAQAVPLRFREFAGGLLEFGNREGGWCWDNELPVHRFYLEPFAIANRLVTNAEYREFIDDGGYDSPLLWLDNGWRRRQVERWHAPLYWSLRDGQWWNWTLGGELPVDGSQPVSHISFYEADAFARWKATNSDEWKSLRLPSEREWEHSLRATPVSFDEHAFADAGELHPAPASAGAPLTQMAGCLWQWTASYYEPYPGYRSFAGALAEYNGKFMDNQRVLRGGSCATPRDHFRVSYRNFWPAETRFQFSGIRLAQTLGT